MRSAAVAWMALVACSKSAPPEAKARPGAMPIRSMSWQGGPSIALRWITDRPAWHTAQPVDWIVPVADRAIVAGKHGWLASFDGATGLATRERTFAAIDGVVDLGNGRIFVLAQTAAGVIGAVLDATTLATLEEKPLSAAGGALPSVARVPDGSLVLALPGEPLALYDVTLRRTRVLDKRTDWTDVRATASAVYASRPNPGYDEYTNAHPSSRDDLTLPTIDIRIMLKTGASDDTGRLPYAVGPDITYQPQAKAGLGWFNAAVFREASDRALDLADDIGVGPAGLTSAFSTNGDTIAVADGGAVELYSTTTGKLRDTFPIADDNFLDERPYPMRALAFTEARLYVAYEQEIRVVDLAKRSVSPVPAPPSASLTGLLVSDSGDVQTIDRVVSRFTNGKRTTFSFRGDALLLATSTLGVYGGWERSKRRDVPSKLVTYRDGQLIKEWPLAAIVTRAWITSRGRGVVFASREPNKLVDEVDGVLYVRTGSSNSTFDIDIDADAGLAITDGQLLDLNTKVADPNRIAGPCRWQNRYRLEPGGTRVVAWSANTALLWDRATRAQVGSVQFTADEIHFLRGTSDLVLHDERGIALWSPATNELRMIPDPSLRLETSPDGRLLGLVFGDGRVALADYATLRAAIPPTPAPPAGVASCPRD